MKIPRLKNPGLKNLGFEKSGVEKSGFEMSCNRQTLLQEPRGYPCQNLNFIFPSQNKEAAFGYVIAEQNCIYPLFSGHNTICVVTALLVSMYLCLKYLINLFSVIHYLVKVTKNEKISCPVYSLFTEKVNFFSVNKEKNSRC